jgi:hypothetical protein
MLLEIFYSLIGTWLRSFLEWIQAHPTVSISVLGLWMAYFFTAKYQLKRIEERTSAFVLENAQEVLAENPQLTSEQLYKNLYPSWCQMLRKTAWFIPHRFELWPVPATPERVRARINFTPEWLASHLWIHGTQLPGASPPKQED